MNDTPFSSYAARLRQFIGETCASAAPQPGDSSSTSDEFEKLARELFTLQFAHNQPYRRWCEARKVTPANLSRWQDVPAMPVEAFKEMDLTCLSPEQRRAFFQSSGTTSEARSRHWHNAETLALYENSLWAWFNQNVPCAKLAGDGLATRLGLLSLTPTAVEAPHSSLVHMFDTVARRAGFAKVNWAGRVDTTNGWVVNQSVAVASLRDAEQSAQPLLVVGTAFSFVHLLDECAVTGMKLRLPAGSLAMETGGYKGRSRVIPKAELHQMISNLLGLPGNRIICEYGMCELSSQAYARRSEPAAEHCDASFLFPPWARVQIISPETGREMGDGEAGLIRVFDLANVGSILAVQTADLGTRLGAGFELIGRVGQAEARGCSLMATE